MQKAEYQSIPTELTEKQFEKGVRPYIPKQMCGPQPKIPLHKIYNYILYVLYTGCQWKSLQKAIDKTPDGQREIHYTTVFKRFNLWASRGVFKQQFMGNLQTLSEQDLLDLSQLNGDGTNTVAKKGGDKVGYSGHKHQKGSKNIVITDKKGTPIGIGEIAPVNHHDTTIFPQSLKDLTSNLEKSVITVQKGAVFNLDPAFDSKYNKKLINDQTMTPNIKVNPRNSNTKEAVPPDPESYKNRYVNERVFAWQDKFRRTITRWETKSNNFFTFIVLSLAMINLRLLI